MDNNYSTWMKENGWAAYADSWNNWTVVTEREQQDPILLAFFEHHSLRKAIENKPKQGLLDVDLWGPLGLKGDASCNSVSLREMLCICFTDF